MPRYSKAALQQQFLEITNTDTRTAVTYLERTNYKLNEAIDQYLASNKNGEVELETDPKIEAIFEKYSEGNDKIDINGTLEYLEDLKIQPEDPKSLTLSYLLASPSMGIFTKREFLRKWTGKANTITGMRKYLDKFHENVIHSKKGTPSEDFHKLYDFTFGFLMEVENQKLLDYELAIEYWNLLLPIVVEVSEAPEIEKINERTKQWYEFVRTEYKRSLSKDSWSMFYLFYKDIMVKDPGNLGEYDEMAAWPSVIDEYMEYLRENSLL